MVRTYKGRSEEEQKEFNKARRNAHRARKESPDGMPIKNHDDDIDLDIDVETEKVDVPMPDWKQSLLSRFQSAQESEPVSKERVKKTENLISHVLPTALAGLLAMYSQKLFSDPYKPCAPSKQEVASILLPIFSVIQRHVAIEGKASQDAIDITTALLAAITVGMRMQLTRMEITNYVNQISQQTQQASNISPIDRGARRDSGGASASTVRSFTGSNGTVEQWGDANDGHDGNGNGTNGVASDESWQAEAVRGLLRKDTLGRRQMGLAPRVLRTDDNAIDHPPA
jgi:hypothetical protein